MSVTEYEEVVSDLYEKAEARATDWGTLEEFLAASPDAERYAEALAQTWRDGSEEAGFNQPAGSLVSLVEDLTGEAVWKA